MDIDQIISTLVKARGLELNPPDPETLAEVLPKAKITAAHKLIQKHIAAGNQIAIYGDYDVDGICATAILWENIHQTYSNVFPHIPHRQEEGYGLSTIGIDHCLEKGAKLIITADSGITAHEQIAYCRSRGCDIIVIDHHEPTDKLPKPNVLLYSKNTCAAGLSWFFCKDVPLFQREDEGRFKDQLALVSLAVICDMVPLLGVNRSLAKFGLQALNATTRPGLLALVAEAGLKPGEIGTYEVGFIIGPRINAMGRLESALDSLRLLCTKIPARASFLAQLLGNTNRTRQELTELNVKHALSSIEVANMPNILVVSDPTYEQGIIGLIAAKLVEKHYRPAIAISVGESESKGSVRSVAGFHITDFLRQHQELFINIGGHAMAAGFTIATTKIPELKTVLENSASTAVTPQMLFRQTRVDAEIPIDLVTMKLYERLQELAPFGLGNPQPVFVSKQVPIANSRRFGSTNQHLRLDVSGLEAVWFNAPQIQIPKTANFTYTIALHTYNLRTNLQLIIKQFSF